MTDMRIDIAAPVLSLLAVDDQLLAGGPGGVAVRAARESSIWRPVKTPMTMVSGLARADDTVIAGGADGIAWSRDGGATWRRAAATPGGPVSAIAASGDCVLAATLGNGVLRSDDGGLSWQPSGFGLPSPDVNALCLAGESVFAGTEAGLCVSLNGGRAWRRVGEIGAAAITAVGVSDAGHCLALGATGRAWCAGPERPIWIEMSSLPAGCTPAAVSATASSWLVGTDHGMFGSGDGGRNWRQVGSDAITCFAVGDPLAAGTATGLMFSRDGGMTWQTETPPVHDISRLVGWDGDVLAFGPTSGIVSCSTGAVVSTPGTLSCLAAGPGDRLFASTPDGLFVRTKESAWQQVVMGEAGFIHGMAFGVDGAGWAASRDGARILATTDGGVHWQVESPAWGAGMVLALAVVGDTVLAATHDPSVAASDLWRRPASGVWQHAVRVKSAQPAVALCSDPPAAAMGTSWLFHRGSRWHRGSGPGGTVRLLTGSGEWLAAVTDQTVALSHDAGVTWRSLADVDPATVVSAVVTGGDRPDGHQDIWALTTDGEVWKRSLSTEN